MANQIDAAKNEAMKQATDPSMIAKGLSVATNLQAEAAAQEKDETVTADN